jgi:hypothetical protein
LLAASPAKKKVLKHDNLFSFLHRVSLDLGDKPAEKKSISCRVSHFYLRLIFAVIAANNKCSIQTGDESFSQQKLNDRNASKWTDL